MANTDHVKKIKEGLESWNSWREKEREVNPDLGWASLNNSELETVNLEKSQPEACFFKGLEFKKRKLFECLSLRHKSAELRP